MICDPALNKPLPATAKPIGSKLTPAMVTACQARTGLPQNTFEQATIDGVRVWFVSNCHTYTVINGQQIPGLFKGCSVWLDTSPAVARGPMVGETTDWSMVAVTAGLLGATVYAFYWALKKADRRRFVRS